MLPSVDDKFVIDGPNGTHPCHVRAPAQIGISVAKEIWPKAISKLKPVEHLLRNLLWLLNTCMPEGLFIGVSFSLCNALSVLC